MIKAIIFDCYGVLMEMDYLQQFAGTFVTTPEKRQRFDELHREVDVGIITREDFIEHLSKLSGMSARRILEEFNQQRAANQGLLGYISDNLRGKYKLAILSNVSSEGISRNFTPEEVGMFDEIVLSSDVGMAKPDPEIFDLTCRRLDVKPSEAVMIDDLVSNCLGAEKAGLKSIRFTGLAALKNDLKAIL